MQKKMIAVVLAGCGHRDGSEIHEATLTLWAIHKHGAEFQCFAPDIPQHHVLNHLTGKVMNEERNVLVESARIARGKIKDIKQFRKEDFDALIFPGGVGVAKNLCTYALEGPQCRVNDDVARIVKAMHAAGKPIGALCIAPVILARVLGAVELTTGQDQGTAQDLATMGARHTSTAQGEITVDRTNKIVTTPCYMLESRVDEIGNGAENLVKAVLEMCVR
ncbi:MAG TPA: isoprenoid biosynthesis protein ElbB [Desulfobulbaceae bacterium]|nr:isoprenoid biosynthesis protein ElbB [Desulfobulbaceae bacterium]